jgi:putative ABC transport system permease protein
MILSLSWKNIWRNRTRSLVVIAAITVGLFGGVFSMAFMNGMSAGRIASAIANEVADIQIHDPAYLDNPDIRALVMGADTLAAGISRIKGITAVSSRIKLNAMAATAATGTGIVLIGADPASEKKVSGIPDRIVEGAYLGVKGKNPVVIGEKLAHKLKAGLRSKIVVTVQGYDSVITGGAFKVVGIFKTENSSFDEMTVFARKNDVQRLSLLPDNAAHEIVCRVANSRDAGKIAQQIAAIAPALAVRPWWKASPELAMLDGLMNYMMYLFLAIILIALAFGIVNTMLMAILERRREIGMLLAVGMTRKRIVAMILVETILLSMTGGAIGMALSGLAILLFGTIGINLTAVAQGLAALGLGTTIYPAISAGFFVVLSFMIVATAALSALYPALKALQIDPAAAIRAE